jgi:hypothetical protein
MRRLILAGFAALLVSLALAAALPGRAEAYPQFQFSSGTNRCSQCHYSPAGGGLITSWGRDESGDTLSLGGDGAFLHGAWTPPSWVALGADIRLATTRTTDGGFESPQTAFFPMQADLYARFAFGDAFSLYLAGGARGEVRPASGYSDTGIGRIDYDLGTIADRFISREHYFMWRPSATGPYARIGRFYAPYGLRFVEHPFFVRRYTGYNLYDETYNISGGYVADDSELHVTAFTPPPSSFPDPLQSVGTRESGGAAYYEQRFAGMAALAAQTRIGFNKETARYQGGLVGKLWIEPAKMLVLGEVDVARLQVSAASSGETQLVSYVGPTFFPVRGLMATLAYERYQEDLSAKGTGRNALDVELNFFPWAHFELVFLGRYIMAGTGAPGSTDASLLMGQLHYYL